jgi:hypothetical protein
MNPALTITIDSANYIEADKELRVKLSETMQPIDPHVAAILSARRLLGFSMHPSHLYSDYVPDYNLIPQ